MKINADDLARRLKQQFDAVYLVSGDDPLLADEACDLIRSAARKQGFTERDLHIAERGFDWARLASDSSNLSLFAEKRLTEIRLPTGKPGKPGAAALCDFVDHIHDDDCLLLIMPKLDGSSRNSAWVKKLSGAGVLVQIWPVSTQQLPGWISNRLKAQGLEASRDAVLMLADRSQGNLLAAQQEITKLSLHFTSGKISTEDVAKSVADSARFDVFQLVDAALVGDVARALRILGGLQSEGVEPTLILWALAREVRTLLSVLQSTASGQRLEQALSTAKVWSNRKSLVGRAARRLRDTKHCVGLLELAAQTDASIKGQSGSNPWSGLRSLVVGISSAGASLSVA